MKKHLFALFSTLFLIFLTSCSALLDNYSSVSVQLPDGLSKQLNFSREEYQQEPVTGGNTNPDNPVEHPYSFVSCTLEVIGDYQTSITNTYDSIDDINGSTISVSNIPVNSKVEVLLTLKCIRDGVPIGGFYGKSKAVTIAKGNNYVDLTLKPATTIDLGLDTDLVIEIYANGRRYTNEVPYADGYEIKLRKGMRYLTDDDTSGIQWKLNNKDLSEKVSNNGNNIFLPQQSIEALLGDDVINSDSYILSCYIPEDSDYGIPPDSAYVEFKIVNYPNTFIWDYSVGSRYQFVPLNDLLQNKVNDDGWKYDSLPSTVIGRNETFYKENNEIYRVNNNRRKVVFNGGFANPKSFDFENNVLFIDNEGDKIRYNPANNKLDPVENLSNDIDVGLITDKYIVEFNYETPTNIPHIYYNSGSEYEVKYEEINLIDKHPMLEGMTLVDKVLINDTLYLLYSEFDSVMYVSATQRGALVALNLKNADSKVIGYSDSRTTGISGSGGKLTVYGLNENSKTAFFAPVKFVAIKDDELYLADFGQCFKPRKDENSSGTYKKCSRIIGVNLKNFAIDSVTTLQDIDLHMQHMSVTGFNAE